jgi:hypothetical protein
MAVGTDVRKLTNAELAELLRRAGESDAEQLARWDRVRRLIEVAPDALAKGAADFSRFYRPPRTSAAPAHPLWTEDEKRIVRESVAAARARGEILATAYAAIHERLPHRSMHAIHRQHKLSTPRALARAAAKMAARLALPKQPTKDAARVEKRAALEARRVQERAWVTARRSLFF